MDKAPRANGFGRHQVGGGRRGGVAAAAAPPFPSLAIPQRASPPILNTTDRLNWAFA